MAIWPVGHSGDHRNIAKWGEFSSLTWRLSHLPRRQWKIGSKIWLIVYIVLAISWRSKSIQDSLKVIQNAAYAREKAVKVRKRWYGNKIFIRGLIELTNICKNDCYYCGIRHSNKNVSRYRLTKEEVMESCREDMPLALEHLYFQGRRWIFYGCSDDWFIERNKENILRLPLPCRLEKEVRKLSEVIWCRADRFLLRHQGRQKDIINTFAPWANEFWKKIGMS